MSIWTMTAIAAGAVASAGAAVAAPPEKIALTGARIIPVVGAEIPTGTVVIEHGTITAVGAGVEVPYDAVEIDCAGKVLFPGMIDPHSARGLDVPNENVAVTPYLSVQDAMDPSRLFFEESLRDGVTAVHVMFANNCVIAGVGRVVRPIGLSVDEMTIEPETALKLSTTPKSGYTRMTQMSGLRQAFAELDDATEKLAETKYEESLKKENKKMDVGVKEARERGRGMIRDEDYADRHRNLVRLRRGDLAAWFYCGFATDVGPAIEMAREQGILERAVFVLGPEAFKAARELRKVKRPVVLDPSLQYRERDPRTDELKETFIPKRIADAGLEFALQPNPGGSMAERYLNYQAAMCVRNGMPRQGALEAITINPAKILGLETRLGSIEAGKAGSILVLSGDPLEFTTTVDLVFIDGVEAYDRTKDRRLGELLRLQTRRDQKPEESGGETKPAPAEDDGATKAGEGAEATATDSVPPQRPGRESQRRRPRP